MYPQICAFSFEKMRHGQLNQRPITLSNACSSSIVSADSFRKGLQQDWLDGDYFGMLRGLGNICPVLKLTMFSFLGVQEPTGIRRGRIVAISPLRNTIDRDFSFRFCPYLCLRVVFYAPTASVSSTTGRKTWALDEAGPELQPALVASFNSFLF